MKIAYIILAHNNPRHLRLLVSALQSKNSDIYIHLDKKNERIFDKNDYFNAKVYSKYIINWGSYNFIESVLYLVNKAMENSKYDYYILLSGSDFPIRNNKFISNFLSLHIGTQFIDIKKMPTPDKPMTRITKYNFDQLSKTILGQKIQIIINFLLKHLPFDRKIPSKYSGLNLYAGTSWWALTHNCLKYIVTYTKNNKDFANYFRHTYNADEMYFHTIIGNSKYSKNIKNTLTFTDWKQGGPHPSQINAGHLKFVKQQNMFKYFEKNNRLYLFARKFSDNDNQIVSVIKTCYEQSSSLN